MFETIFPIMALSAALILMAIAIIPYFYGAPWHPSSHRTIRIALELCQPQSGETLYDLGCGDGRTLLIGAKELNLKCVGVEIDPVKTWLARWRIKKAGLEDSIRIEQKNIIGFDVGSADIIYTYLTHQALDKLLPTLKVQMKPGSRLVSYRFCLKGETPDQIAQGGSIFLYRFAKGSQVNFYS